MKRERRIWALPGSLQPILPFATLFEPVAGVQARGGLRVQEVVQLAFVVVQRHERKPKRGSRRAELLLEAEQTRDLFFARSAPSCPEVHPRPFAGTDTERVGQRASVFAR